MGTGNMLLGVTLQWTSILSRGEYQYSQLLHATETRITSGRVSLFGSCVILPLPYISTEVEIGLLHVSMKGYLYMYV